VNTQVFLITAGAIVLAWIANFPIETKLVGRKPTAVEVTLSTLGLIAALFGLFVTFRNWERIKTDDIYVWGAGALFFVVLGVLLEVFMTTLETGKGFKDLKPYPLFVALLMAIPAFLGLWTSLEEPKDFGTLVLAVTAGYGWKGFADQAKKIKSQA
jgi:hypothetical protein